MEYRKVERCENEECRLVFLEHEKNYPCCPYCADVRMNKLPKDENKKKIVIAEILKYEDRMAKLERFSIGIFDYGVIPIILVGVGVSSYFEKGEHFSRSSFDSAVFALIGIFLIFFFDEN